MGHRRVNEVTLAMLVGAHNDVLSLVLLRNERRNVGLEGTSADTDDYDGDGETSQRAIGVRDDRRQGSNDELW